MKARHSSARLGVRRTPEGDDWDGPVAIVGVWDNGPDFGLEFVVQTVAFTGQPTLTSDAESLRCRI